MTLISENWKIYWLSRWNNSRKTRQLNKFHEIQS